MATGVGAETLQTIPTAPFVIDPQGFFSMTEKNVSTIKSLPAPGAGQFTSTQLLAAGVVSKLLVNFTGTLVVSTAAVTTGDNWPYNLLSQFQLSANGQNDLFNCDGVDLHVLRYCSYPAYVESVDQFPGTVGGGDSVGTGTYNISLTWEVPIAMDQTSLVGALFAQSSSTNLQVRLVQAALTELFSANPSNAAISGTFSIQETFYEIPFAPDGRMVIPDLTRLHGFNAVDAPFTNVGEVRVPMIRSAGQLSRLFISARSSATNRLSGLPSAASTKVLDALRIEYGGNQRPYVFEPLRLQLAVNNDHYGRTPPYDRVVLDLVRENPIRDLILLQGVTELAAVPRVGSGVTVTAGKVRLVQETLF